MSRHKERSPKPDGFGLLVEKFTLRRVIEISALGELRSATGGLQTGLLTLLHTRIAGQETGLLQDGAVILAGQQQSAGHTVTPVTVATMSILPVLPVASRG